MKTLIVYYSKTGHAKKIALDMAVELGADTEEIIDMKNRKGFLNWFLSGRDGMKKIGTEIAELTKNPAEYDLVIAGSPVWGWNMVPAVRTYLERNRNKIKKFAYFITSGNTDSEKLLGFFREIINCESVAWVGFNAKEFKEEDLYKQKMANFIGSLKSNF